MDRFSPRLLRLSSNLRRSRKVLAYPGEREQVLNGPSRSQDNLSQHQVLAGPRGLRITQTKPYIFQIAGFVTVGKYQHGKGGCSGCGKVKIYYMIMNCIGDIKQVQNTTTLHFVIVMNTITLHFVIVMNTIILHFVIVQNTIILQ